MRKGLTVGIVLAFALGLAPVAHGLPLDDLVDGINTVRADSAKSKKAADAVKKQAQDELEAAKTAFGANSDKYKTFKAQVDELLNKLDAAQMKVQLAEKRDIAILSADHDEEIRILNKHFPPVLACGCIGQLLVDGSPGPGLADDGQIVLLTFRFVDAETGLALDPSLSLGSVLFQVNRDPETPDVFDPIGVSAGPGGVFSLPFTIDSFEPLFEAIPYDTAGAPIFIAGLNGENEARAFNLDIPGVPEPTAWALMVLGFAGLGLALRGRARGLGASGASPLG